MTPQEAYSQAFETLSALGRIVVEQQQEYDVLKEAADRLDNAIASLPTNVVTPKPPTAKLNPGGQPGGTSERIRIYLAENGPADTNQVAVAVGHGATQTRLLMANMAYHGRGIRRIGRSLYEAT